MSVTQSKEPASQRFRQSAGGVLYRRQGRKIEVLIGHQRDWNTDQPTVRLPKGHVEPGETLEQTAVREVREETGRLAALGALLDESAYEFTNRETGERVSKRVQYYLLEDRGPAPGDRDDEMLRVEWLPLDAAQRALTFENERAIVRLAARALQLDDLP